MIKVIDRLLPLLLNLNTEGKTWKNSGIKRSQVEQAPAFIAVTFPALHKWIWQQIECATEQG